VQTKVKTVEAAIIRIDETLVRIDERFNRIDKTLARLDERSKGDRFLLRFVVLPLLVLMQATLLGILTRGILWNIQP